MKFYTHKLSLIERTKLLEGIYCQSLTFTDKNANIFPEFFQSALVGDSSDYFENLYKTPVYKNSEITIVNLHHIASQVAQGDDRYFLSQSGTSLIIKQGDTTLTYNYNDANASQNIQLEISEKTEIKYSVRLSKKVVEDAPEYITVTLNYLIGVYEDYAQTKPWTITSGINRVLDLAEPLFLGDTPRFILNPIQAQKWENTPLPNTTMTQCTLREQLQHIGNYVHSQARLGGYLTESVTYNGITYNAGYYENMIFFDEYGQEEESTLQGKPYVSNQIRHSINDYNTQIDTSAQNIVNTLDYGDGVIVSPDAESFKSVRTEGINVRLQDSNCIIATEFPIYDIISVKCKGYYKNDGGYAVDDDGKSEFDITPFVYESHEYNSVLSSFGGGYPYSKSYAIYYTQGEKNINGLFFKATTETSSVYGDYINNFSIVNILEVVSKGYGWKKYVEDGNIPCLSFQITYIPFYQTRYSHTDGYIIGQDRKLPFTKIYNQSENVIETRFYGENIKGVAKRLGNQEATRTYHLGSINSIPKVGTMLDGYYISQAVTEYMPFSIRCTVGLTKNFNRLSQNVGINSHKRVAEVSEREAYKRNILLKEYICIGSNEELPLKPSVLQPNVESTLQMLRGIDTIAKEELYTMAQMQYMRKNKGVISTIKAPIVSSAFGNCMTFSWTMKDNYSAGEQVDLLDNGFWQRDVAYSDYYGRAYYLDFQLLNYKPFEESMTDAMTVVTEFTYIAGKIGTPSVPNPFVLRKDSREIINMNVAIEYISNRQDLILGSALASCNPIVSNSKKDANGDLISPKVYFFAEKINQYEHSIINKTPVWTDEKAFTDPDVTQDHIYIRVSNVPDGLGYNSWCLAYPVTEKTRTVYNDDTGENEEYTTYTGGEILIACNNSKDYYINNNIEFDYIYINPYSDKYKDYEG